MIDPTGRRTTYHGVKDMAKKRDRAFFICPRWNEVLAATRSADGRMVDVDLSPRTAAAIAEGRPVARSTLRKALRAVRRASGLMFDVDDHIVDQRGGRSSA